MQSDIVSKFPSELQKGTAQEGVPENLYKLGEVIEQLGISDDVQAGHEWPGVKDEILAQKDVVNQNANLLLGTVWPSKHCLRVRKVTADGVEVMDPATGTDRPLTWAECEQHKMTCIFL